MPQKNTELTLHFAEKCVSLQLKKSILYELL